MVGCSVQFLNSQLFANVKHKVDIRLVPLSERRAFGTPSSRITSSVSDLMSLTAFWSGTGNTKGHLVKIPPRDSSLSQSWITDIHSQNLKSTPNWHRGKRWSVNSSVSIDYCILLASVW